MTNIPDFRIRDLLALPFVLAWSFLKDLFKR